MNILILGLNYAPEPVGIGPYTAGMAAALAAAGHHVTVICGKPYYPAWTTDPAFVGGGIRRSLEHGVHVVRVPIYVPTVPNGRRRLLHHASFALRALPAMLLEAKRRQPDVVIGIAPSLISTFAARITARAFGAKLWLHVQDFEVEAAFATGLLSDQGPVARFALWFERLSLTADRISTISPQMCAKLIQRGINANKVIEFRNWANIDHVVPLHGPSSFRDEWKIAQPHIALYSGNIANKQGIEIIVEAARLLKHRDDLLFVICGVGPNRDRLVESARDCDNIRFFGLQPMNRLSDLLGLASVHLLPQIAGAADLVLPSKLTNILASGRAVIAGAPQGSGLAIEVEGVGLVTEPGNAHAFAGAITQMLDDDELRRRLGHAARQRAEDRWSRSHILERFERALRACVGPARSAPKPEKSFRK